MTASGKAIVGTEFEGRLADSRTTGTGVTATTNIVDLSTMEQMLLAATTGGTKKAEHIKPHHVSTLMPYAKEFLALLSEVFGDRWPAVTQDGQDTYRRIYFHGWASCLKALGLAYYRVRIKDLAPISAAISAVVDGNTSEEAFTSALEEEVKNSTEEGKITLSEFKERLSKIDWTRHRKHWVDINGQSEKDGVAKTVTLKNGDVVVSAQAPNTNAVISKIVDRILSDNWTELTAGTDAPV